MQLRHVPSVERLAHHLTETLPSLDLLINNAAQTVRRPPAFYRSLVEREEQPIAALSDGARALLTSGEGGPGALVRFHAADLSPARLTQLALTDEDVRDAEAFPPGVVDLDDQQADFRHKNSWRMRAADVSTVELLEVHLVNSVAPYLLVARCKPLMLRRTARDKHVVNVSAMEAQFARNKKTEKHPHTNMAKAALNMLTRTSAADLVQDGIHMNSVDTGWVTDEDPAAIAARKVEEHGFSPPLDIVDGAARICDPIFAGINAGQHAYGLFFKDYKPVPW